MEYARDPGVRLINQLRVLHIVNCWPTEKLPIRGVFIKEQIESLSEVLQVCDVHIVSPLKGSLIRGYIATSYRSFKSARNYSVLHVHHLITALFMLPFLPFIKARTVLSLMNDPGHNIKGLPRLLDSFLIYFASIFFDVIIYKGREPLVTSKTRLHHLPNAVSMEFFEPIDKKFAKESIGLQHDKKYLLFVSANSLDRAIKRKDLFDEVVAMLKGHGFAPLYMSNVPRESVPLYYASSDALLLVSDAEGSPNAVKEALASGVPVIGRRLPGVEHLLEGCHFCEMFESDDPEPIANMVLDVLQKSSPDEIRAHVRRLELNPAHVRNKLIEIYADGSDSLLE